MIETGISGYIQIVLGGVGIAVTMLTAPSVFDAASRIRAGEGLPPGFAGAAGAIRVFTVIFALVVFAFLVGLGLAVTLSSIAKAFGAARPMLCSSLLVSAVIGLATTATFAIYRSRLAAPSFIGTGVLATWSIVAALESSVASFWTAVTAGMTVFLTTSLGTVMYGDRSPG